MPDEDTAALPDWLDVNEGSIVVPDGETVADRGAVTERVTTGEAVERRDGVDEAVVELVPLTVRVFKFERDENNEPVALSDARADGETLDEPLSDKDAFADAVTWGEIESLNVAEREAALVMVARALVVGGAVIEERAVAAAEAEALDVNDARDEGERDERAVCVMVPCGVTVTDVRGLREAEVLGVVDLDKAADVDIRALCDSPSDADEDVENVAAQVPMGESVALPETDGEPVKVGASSDGLGV